MKTLALCAVLIVTAFSASAQDATLVKIKGRVSRRVAGSKTFVAVKGGEGLVFGDAIHVAKGGVAHLTLSDDRGAVLLRDETLMTLKGAAGKTELSVAYGEFIVGLRKKLAKGESFKVRSPAAVAAVRGTLFWGKSDKADKGAAYVSFGHVISVRAQGKTVLVEPGQTVTVAYGQAPTEAAPSSIGLDYAQNFAIGGSLQGVDALAETEKLKK
jgi:hypothetical protein